MSKTVTVNLYRRRGDIKPLHQIRERILDKSVPSFATYKQKIIDEAVQLGKLRPGEVDGVHVEMDDGLWQ